VLGTRDPVKVEWVRTTYRRLHRVGGFGIGRVDGIGRGEPPPSTTPFYAVRMTGVFVCSPSNDAAPAPGTQHGAVVTAIQRAGGGRETAFSSRGPTFGDNAGPGAYDHLSDYGTVHAYAP
jgi:hypothetical protein